MTADDLAAYVVKVRDQAHATIARIDAMDLGALPAEERAEYTRRSETAGATC
jgi:hypothetical protein